MNDYRTGYSKITRLGFIVKVMNNTWAMSNVSKFEGCVQEGYVL